jgi:hypothetical protein
MIGYVVDGQIVIITADGAHTSEERDAMYDAIRDDARVADGSLLLIDARGNALPSAAPAVRETVASMVERLGPKLGRACALVRPPDRQAPAVQFQLTANTYDIRVGVFTDVAAAREWLEVHAQT